jgi:N-acetylglutamate synthase-like GNAT family acetyltransferase
MQIDLLANRPGDIDVLVGPMFEYWRRVTSDDTIEARRERLRGHLNRTSLPMAWVAHNRGVVLGTAALRVTDLPGHDHLTPWLSGVFVLPGHQRRGVGTALCHQVEVCARQMGHSRLYLFTLDQQALYQRMGWRFMDKGSWMGVDADVMTKIVA